MEVSTSKRFSISVPRKSSEARRVTLRPFDSFRERKESSKHQKFSFGYAALSTEGRDIEHQQDDRSSPTPSVFSIYGDDPGPATICEQPIGAQADVYISSLGDKKLQRIRKYMEVSPPLEHQYFLWVKENKNDKITVLSLRTIQNHLKSEKRVRRVKWRHLSTERISVYRYSIPAISYEKSKLCRDCIMRHKKVCLLAVWLFFVFLLCAAVVLGSIHEENRNITMVSGASTSSFRGLIANINRTQHDLSSTFL